MPFCTNCGAEVSGMKFCSKCGTPAAAPSAGVSEPTPESTSAAPGGTASPQASAQTSSEAGPAQAAPQASSGRGGPSATVPESSQHIAAALSYITPVAILLLLIEPYKDIRFVRFHSYQSIFYCVAAIVVQTIGAFLGPLGFLVTLAVIFGWFYVLIKAYQGEMFEIPIIGPLAAQQV